VRSRSASARRLVAVGCLLGGVALAGCGGAGADSRAHAEQARSALVGYLREVEPIRLAVNRLLDTADPVLKAFREHRITGTQATSRMSRLERRFAAYAVDVQAIRPRLPALASLHSQYAQTYILEDAYLSALAAGLADGNLDELPHTQAVQRASIIAWRIGITVLARQTNASLPPDLQQAGRGEIAPSPGGS
jgi:hypothetical protein